MDTLALIRTSLGEHLGVDPDRITPEARLRDDLGLDSLESVELLLQLEEALDTELDLGRIEGLSTIGDLLAYIEQMKLQQEA